MVKRYTEKQRQELRRDMIRQGYQIGSVDQTWGKLGEALFNCFATNGQLREVRLVRTGEVAYESFSLPSGRQVPRINNCDYGGTLVGPVSLRDLDLEEFVSAYRELGLPKAIRVIEGVGPERAYTLLFQR